MFSGMSY